MGIHALKGGEDGFQQTERPCCHADCNLVRVTSRTGFSSGKPSVVDSDAILWLHPPARPNIHVRASAGVTCYLAKRMMRMLIDWSKACYPNGYTRTPHCRLWGFRCSAHPIDGGHGSRGRCVKGRKLATGVAHV